MLKNIDSILQKAMPERTVFVVRSAATRCRISLRLRNLMGVALATGALLSGCSAKPEAEVTPTVTVQVDAAEKEAIQRKVIADATLYPLDQAAIVPKVTSPVAKFFVDKGSRVKKGQVLAELENQDLTAAREKSQGGYVQAEATYQMEVQKTAQDAKLAKETMDAAQKFYDGRVAKLKEGAVSEKDVEDAAVALTTAKNQYDLAQKQSDLKVAEGALNAAKGDTANAEAQLSYTRITSPIDGVVTDRPVYAGEDCASWIADPYRDGHFSSRCPCPHRAIRGGATEGWRPCDYLRAGADPSREGKGDSGKSGAGRQQHYG